MRCIRAARAAHGFRGGSEHVRDRTEASAKRRRRASGEPVLTVHARGAALMLPLSSTGQHTGSRAPAQDRIRSQSLSWRVNRELRVPGYAILTYVLQLTRRPGWQSPAAKRQEKRRLSVESLWTACRKCVFGCQTEMSDMCLPHLSNDAARGRLRKMVSLWAGAQVCCVRN